MVAVMSTVVTHRGSHLYAIVGSARIHDGHILHKHPRHLLLRAALLGPRPLKPPLDLLHHNLGRQGRRGAASVLGAPGVACGAPGASSWGWGPGRQGPLLGPAAGPVHQGLPPRPQGPGQPWGWATAAYP